MKIEVGDIVCGILGTRKFYGMTNDSAMCEVVAIDGDTCTLKIIEFDGKTNHQFVGTEHQVDTSWFRLVSKKPCKHETLMDKTPMEDKAVIPDNLVDNIVNLLDEYGYPWSYEHVQKWVDIWFEEKSWLIRLLSKLPNWNPEKLMVVFSANYNREIDLAHLSRCASTLFTVATAPETDEMATAWYYMLQSIKEQYIDNESHNGRQALEYAVKIMEMAGSSYRPHNGVKASRMVKKIAGIIGVDKAPGFNKAYVEFADALNPLQIVRHTIISVNPIDYLTMSFGNTWASCHTIDKGNRRNTSGEHYHGMYSGGTLSYMLDPSSLVFYTVDERYDGKDFERQDKINRVMFHLGEDKLVQGRVYPQENDGSTDMYEKTRAIVQRQIAEALGVTNDWLNAKGTEECEDVIYTPDYTMHYPDYLNFDRCNVSYLRRGDSGKNFKKITVGNPDVPCPACGGAVEDHNYIVCDWHKYDINNDYTCARCGCEYEADYLYEINGEHYCDECSFYCEYHEEREIGGYTYVDGYGRVCDSALESGYFIYCDYCEEWYYTRYIDDIYTDDRTYCSPECAENDGNVELSNGVYVPEREVATCDNCGCLERIKDMVKIDGEYYCTDCAEEVEEDEVA